VPPQPGMIARFDSGPGQSFAVRDASSRVSLGECSAPHTDEREKAFALAADRRLGHTLEEDGQLWPELVPTSVPPRTSRTLQSVLD